MEHLGEYTTVLDRVLDIEVIYLRLLKILVRRVTVVKFGWTIEAAMVPAVLELQQGQTQRSS